MTRTLSTVNLEYVTPQPGAGSVFVDADMRMQLRLVLGWHT